MSTAGGDLDVSGQPLPDRARRSLSAALAGIERGELRTDCPLVFVEPDDAQQPYVLALSVASQPRASQRVVGFMADPIIVTELFTRVLDQSSLLPESLASRADELLSVRVTNNTGTLLFSSSDNWTEYASESVLEPELGSLRLSVALRRDAAEKLVIGGLPRSRIPLLNGLLALTTGLVIVALVQLRRERELVRLRAEFVSGVSHELRTPLTQIRMFGEMLQLRRLRSPRDYERALSIIVNEAKRLTHLIENVLRFSGSDRTDALVLEPVRIDELLRDIVDSFEPLARAKHARLERRLEPGILSTVDANALRQVVLNLLDNALKFGPVGQTITVTARQADGDVVISVEDQGPGVPVADQNRIWQPFYRSSSHPPFSGGTGLGLAIVKRLVEAHRGQVRVEPGTMGSRFTVQLPIGSGREIPAASEAPKRAVAGG